MVRKKQNAVNIENSRVKISGDFVGRDKIIRNIKFIHERALSATEEAKLSHDFDQQELAKGISFYVNRLHIHRNEVVKAGTKGPYKGLLEYRLSDAEIFFGRQNAIRELLEHLNRSNLTILHSESGAGKSSLLQAGVSPHIIADGHLPIYVRPYDDNPVESIKRSFLPDLAKTPSLANAPLQDFLRRVCEVLGPQTTAFILIDQFEEFFTRLKDSDQQGNFVNSLADCLEDTSLNVCWVLSLRSDHFGNLASFRPRIKNPFSNDYQLKLFTREEAREIVLKPAEHQELQFEPGLVSALLDDLGGNEIAPSQLQLVCLALFEELENDQKLVTLATYHQEGGAMGILRGHLERVLSRTLSPAQRKIARPLLESLVSSDAQRVMRSYKDMVFDLKPKQENLNELDATLNQLIDSRLVQEHESEDGIVYELAHDYLVGEIKLDPDVQSRKAAQELLEQEVLAYRRHKTLIAEERLKLIEPHRDRLHLSPAALELLVESQKAVQRGYSTRRRLQLFLVSAVMVAAIVMALLGIYGLNRSNEAQKQASIAQAANTQSAINLSNAETAGTLAVEQRNEAQKQAQIALSRQLAAQAITHLENGIDLASLLSVEAYKTNDGYEARSSLLASLQYSPYLRTILGSRLDRVTSIAFSPDGNLIATGGCSERGAFYVCNEGGIILWDVSNPETILPTIKLKAKLDIYGNEALSLAFSPDGKLLAAGFDSGDMVLWDITNPKSPRHYDTTFMHGDQVTNGVITLTFSHDSKILVSGSQDKTAILWDISNPSAPKPIGSPLTGYNGWVHNANFSPDDKLVAIAGPNTVILWDITDIDSPVQDGVIPKMKDDISITSSSLTPNGKILAVGNDDGTITFWDITDPMSPGSIGLQDSGHDGAITSLAFDNIGNILASGGLDKKIVVWDVSNVYSPKPLASPMFGHTDAGVIVTFSPNGKLLASITAGNRLGESLDQSLIFWDMPTLNSATQLAKITDYSKRFSVIAISPNGRLLASASCIKSTSSLIPCDADEVILWDISNPKMPSKIGDSLTVFDDRVLGLAFDSTGNILATSDLHSITLWNLSNPSSPIQLGSPIKSDGVSSLAFSQDNKVLLAGGDMAIWSKNGVLFWNVSDLNHPIKIEPVFENVPADSLFVTASALSPDGKILATGNFDLENMIVSINLWDITNLASPTPIGIPLSGHPNRINIIAFSSDGKMLASSSGENSTILWDISNLTNPKVLGVPLTNYRLFNMVFSPDDKMIAAIGGDDEIVLWDITNPGSPFLFGKPLIGHTDSVSMIAFSSDGKFLASASNDGTIILWDMNVKNWILNACQRAGRNFTRAEWKQYLGDQPYRKTCDQWDDGK